MDNDSIVEQIVRSLSFEVEAIPQDNVIHLTSTTKSAPLNVRIRVRKKEETGFRHGVLSMPKPDRPDSIPERVRLASSDQTIMSFNVVMEADFVKPLKKTRKNILGIFKPSICLGAEPDEDEYAYMPNNSRTTNINDESTSKSEGALTKFTLSKNLQNDKTPKTVPKRNKDFFGKCKPGGCLDPPFGEERHPYVPAKVDEQTKSVENIIKAQTAGPFVGTKTRTSSTISDKLFNWKRKSANDKALDDHVITKETKDESVLDLYQAGSLKTSATYSNSIMTYPSTLNSSDQLRIQEEKQRGSRIYNDSSKNSFNVHSGSYFRIPKNPKNVFDKNNSAKMKEDGDLKLDEIHKNPVGKSNITKQQDLEDGIKHALEIKDSIKTDVNTIEFFLNLSETRNKKDFNHDKTSVAQNNITKQQDLKDDETKHALETKESATIEVNIAERDLMNTSESKNRKDFNNDKPFYTDQNNITRQPDLEANETKYALEIKDSEIYVNIGERDLINPTESKYKKDFNHNKTLLDQNSVTKQQDLIHSETKNALETKNSVIADADISERDLLNFGESEIKKDVNHDGKTSVDQNNIGKQQYLKNNETKHALEAKDSATTEVNITERDLMNPSDSKNKKDFNNDKPYYADQNNITKQQDLKANEMKYALEIKDSPEIDVNIGERDLIDRTESKYKKDFNHYKTSLYQNNVTKQQDLIHNEIKHALETKNSVITEADISKRYLLNLIKSEIKKDVNHDKTSVDQNNIGKQQYLKDDEIKHALESKDSATTNVNIREGDLMNPSESKNKTDFNHDKTSVDQNSVTKQPDLIQNETKHSLETEASVINEINISERDLMNLSKSEIKKDFKYDKTSVDQNNIGNQRDLKDNETLDTKYSSYNSSTTNFNNAGSDLIISISKHNQDLAGNSITILKPLNTQTEQIESINTLTQQDLTISNLNVISNSVIEKQKSVHDSKSDAMKKHKSEHNVEIDGEIHKAVNVDEVPLVADYRKSTLAKEPAFDIPHLTDTEIENIMQSVVTIDVTRAIAVYDIRKENLSRKTSAEGLEVEGSMKTLTPIKRDTPLELINVDNDDLQQIWKNNNEPLTSDTKLNTENEVNKPNNILIELLNNKVDTFGDITETESFSQTEIQTVLPENKLKELMQNEYEKAARNEIQSVISQTANINGLENNNIVKQNVSITQSVPASLDKIDAIYSVISQKLEHFAFERHLITTPVVTEFENIIDIMDRTQHSRLSKGERIGSEQIQTEMFSNIDPDNNTISNSHVPNLGDDGIHEFNRNKHSKLQQQPQLNFDTTKIIKFITGQNKADENHMFDPELEVAKPDQINHFDQESHLDMDSRADHRRTVAASKTTGFDRRNLNEHSSSQILTSENTSKHKRRPILLNIAIQSYVDDDNQVIIKSFDPNNVPQRFPQDFLKITKHFLETDDKIRIPIDSENIVYIQIKNHKQRNKENYISGIEGNKVVKDNTNKWNGINHESKSEHIKRNVAVAEEVRKTLEAVYEKELLPLRNTISELKENIEMLTMHHMVLRGHMFVKKSRTSKILPLCRKCGCMKK